MKYTAVIFDMDGLLVDSEPVWAACETAMLTARGKVWDLEIQQRFIGMRMTDFLAGMINGYGLTDTAEALREEVLTALLGRMHEVLPRPGAQELLDYLQAQRIPCAIASSSAMTVIDAVVTSHGWDSYFAVHTSGEEVASGKPAPDVYLEAARRLGVIAGDCLALEDSPNGARSAVAAGMVCYAVPDPSHTSHEAFDGITTDIFDSLHEVLDHLRHSV